MKRSKKIWIIIITLGILGIAAITIGPLMSRVETPKYDVISSVGSIESRHYDPMIIAEVSLTGDRSETMSNGFRLLADYIFGNNSKKTKVPMTAPVQQQHLNDAWHISFVMPSEYTMPTLPTPDNKNVKLKEIPEKNFITIRFSGTSSHSNLTTNEKTLLEHIKKNNIETVGPPKYAFYNPPWTLPFMRRNEIMFELKS